MIILSQNRKRIVNFNNIISIESGKELENTLFVYGYDSVIPLGDYSKKDKKDIIRKICSAYCTEQKMFIMPEDK